MSRFNMTPEDVKQMELRNEANRIKRNAARAKRKEGIEAALACASRIEEVTCTQNVTKGGNVSYCYTAKILSEDGTTYTEEVIRKKSTTCYYNAFMFSCEVCTGKQGLGAIFTFGNRTANWGEGVTIFSSLQFDHEAKSITYIRR